MNGNGVNDKSEDKGKKTKTEIINENLDYDNGQLTINEREELIKWTKTSQSKLVKLAIEGLDDETQTKDEHFDSLCQYWYTLKEKASVLIFSSYDGTFNNCKTTMNKYKMLYEEIKGTPDHIQKIVEKYDNQEVNSLMLNSKHMGFGMNLQTTTDIVIMHKMTKEMENQVIGRAYRIGKKTPLRVWYIYNQTEAS